MRLRSFDTSRLKLSDADRNPVDMAAIAGWRVAHTAQAAWRHIPTSLPYDAAGTSGASLPASTDVVADQPAPPVINTGTLCR